jgi:thiosulfate dehydrogenase
MEKDNNKIDSKFILILIAVSAITLIFTWAVFRLFPENKNIASHKVLSASSDTIDWFTPDIALLDSSGESKRIKYGRELVVHTSLYLGPKGSISHISNGMNCQNCHLDAGTKMWGNNYSAVASTYPKYRERSGAVESTYKRINDCFERSLNGTVLDTASDEMQAIKAYIVWLGKDIPRGKKIKGAGITEVPYLWRAADPVAGKMVYMQKCRSCHKENGEGTIDVSGVSFQYQYPPLWGPHSYNDGAGLYRLSRIAGYIKSNMPFGSSYDAPQLTDEQAWDVAAYINSQPRPSSDKSKDWPKLSAKPIDYPFGPYTDTFSEAQHKYGPFGPIAEARKKQAKNK